MNIQTWEVFGAKIDFGAGAIRTLGMHLKRLKISRPLIVTDRGIVSAGILKRIEEVLGLAGILGLVYDKASEDPTDHDVVACCNFYKNVNADSLIGLGGGSPIDLAKAVRLLATHREPLHQYYGTEGMLRITNEMPPLVAIPTTSGTGTEASRGATITDTSIGRKQTVRSGMPSISIVDPELTLTLPPDLTAATGMDAITHAIEAIISNRTNQLAEAFGIKAIELAGASIERATTNGQDISARADMALASTLGALAFQKGLGVNHSIAHQLSVLSTVRHGLANAILLPYTMRFNESHCQPALSRIATALGMSADSNAAIVAIEKLLTKLRLPSRLSQAGVPHSLLEEIARRSLEDWCHQSNPRRCSLLDIQEILNRAF